MEEVVLDTAASAVGPPVSGWVDLTQTLLQMAFFILRFRETKGGAEEMVVFPPSHPDSKSGEASSEAPPWEMPWEVSGEQVEIPCRSFEAISILKKGGNPIGEIAERASQAQQLVEDFEERGRHSLVYRLINGLPRGAFTVLMTLAAVRAAAEGLLHPSLEILAKRFPDGWMSQIDVAEATGLSQPTARDHLEWLVREGLVEKVREGKFIKYRAVWKVVRILTGKEEDPIGPIDLTSLVELYAKRAIYELAKNAPKRLLLF